MSKSSEETSYRTLRLAVLLSGGGRTMQNLANYINQGDLNAEIGIVISSSERAYGLIRAAKLNLPTVTVLPNPARRAEGLSDLVFDKARRIGADLVCMAGFLNLVHIPDDFATRVINIHPALLPSFGGIGMYGHHVHEAVLAAGCKISGCTVHYCNSSYDTGPIIVQRTCPVLESDSGESLAARVFEQECLAYPKAINLISQGQVRLEGSRVRILNSKSDLS